MGLWSDDQIPGMKRIVDVVHVYGSKMGVQVSFLNLSESSSIMLVARAHSTILVLLTTVIIFFQKRAAGK